MNEGHHQIGCVRLQSLCLHLSLFRPGINFIFENRLYQNRVENEKFIWLLSFSLRLFFLVSCNILLAGFLSYKELAKSHAQNLNRKENPAFSYSDVELQVCSVLLFGGQYRRRDIAKALPGSLTRLIHPLPTLSLSRWSQTQNVKYRPRLTHDRKYTGNTEMWRQIRSNCQFDKDSTLTSNEAAKHIIRQETIWKSFYSISYILD